MIATGHKAWLHGALYLICIKRKYTILIVFSPGQSFGHGTILMRVAENVSCIHLCKSAVSWPSNPTDASQPLEGGLRIQHRKGQKKPWECANSNNTEGTINPYSKSLTNFSVHAILLAAINRPSQLGTKSRTTKELGWSPHGHSAPWPKLYF